MELTSPDIGRDMQFMKEVSEKTGVHVIAATGYYLQSSHPPSVAKRSIEELCQEFVSEIEDGVGSSGIKCGVIGEVGSSFPMTGMYLILNKVFSQDVVCICSAQERKVLEAASTAQAQLGCPISVHTSRCPDSPFELLRIIQEAGGDVRKTVLDHIDSTSALTKVTRFCNKFC